MSEIISWDNASRRANGAPLLETTVLDLLPGQYAQNNGVTVLCHKDANGNEYFYVSVDANFAPESGGFQKVDAYVPFSSGVNRTAAPVVARFMEEQMGTLEQ